ncbi:MAG: T9SS type A sorting domain-containing protein [Ignavibacteriae bacterium]|nr:T9SS type A sorting domain-containing protein [Ignavibacteriota bacterium]
MKFRLQILVLALLLVVTLSCISTAQISVDGKPLSNDYQVKSNVETFTMPSFDLDKMLREDAFESQYKDIPPRFGKDFDVNFGYGNSGTIDVLPNGTKIWRVKIISKGAMSINLIFDKFNLPKGSTFFVYSADKKQIYGAFTDLNNQPTNVFSTTPCKGEEILLEYNAPLGLRDPEINVSKVVHAYKDIFNLMKLKDYGTSGTCNRNIICPEGDPYREIARSVAVIIVGGIRNCTGSLLNNTRNDGTPFFMTANHCWDAGVATWVFMFKYEAPSCPNPGGDGPLTYSISGCTFLARNAASDFCLVKLSSKPPVSYNVYYTGWNRSNVPSTSGECIHHPAGDVKKISFYNVPNTPTSYNAPAVPGDSSHWHTTWASIPSTGLTPITEGGSSGSPLYDQNKRFIGQLHGGPSSCTASDKSDYYGKFDQSWNGGGTSATGAKYWLDSANTGVYVIGGYDPNSGPLNTFSLQVPVAGVTVQTVPGSSTVYSFNWDTSSTSASYKWIFGNSLPTRQLTIPLTTRPWNVTLGQLDAYLAALGVPQGGSISGSWDVWAFRNNAPINDSLKAGNGPRTITFTRTQPTLSAFSLISPGTGVRVETQSGSTTPLVANWTKSGAGTTYKWFYASPNFSSAANIKFRLTADNSGFDSTLSITNGAMDAMLSGIGIAMGDSTVGQWRVYAYSGADSLASLTTNNITFKRLSITTACIGTGTTSSNYPFTTYWMDGRTQMLFTAAEIAAAGGTANAVITKLGFNVLTADPGAMNGFNVKMQHTAQTSLTAFVTTGWTTVFSGTYTVPGTGMQYINLTAPYFQWNGTGNIIVEICYDNTAYTQYSTVNSTANTGKTWGYYTDNSTGCTMTGGAAIANRPNVCFSMTTSTGISGNVNQSGLPINYALSQNYPNPFNPVTKINFAIPRQGFVTLKIYDMLGREVKSLVNEIKPVGFYSVDFNASDFASGVYFYRLESEGFKDVKRMMLIK